MPEIQLVYAQLGNNRVAEGFYTLSDGLLTMVYRNGRPVVLEDGSTVTHQMRPDDNARSIAVVLTKEIRKKLLKELIPGFGREIDYPSAGIA